MPQPIATPPQILISKNARISKLAKSPRPERSNMCILRLSLCCSHELKVVLYEKPLIFRACCYYPWNWVGRISSLNQLAFC